VGGDERRLRERIQSANANASVCSAPPRRVFNALVTTPVLHEGRPERLLVITAHPDDADFGVAGSVARWVREGTVARLVCCTSGDAGSDDARTDPLELAALREREQRDAAAIVGYESVTYLHQPDGALANDLALREQLVRILRTFRPDTVAAPDPTVIIHDDGFIQHVDHRAAAMAAVDAVYPASQNAMAFPHLVTAEGLEPHVVTRLYLFWSDRSTVVVDISDTIDTKVAALRAHVSQLRKPDELEAFIRERSAETGKGVGIAAGEAFRIVDLER
jgi:LmbE family N-acetylglucosaminyl deacetylase